MGLHDAEGHLVALVQLMSAVHLALKSWLLPDRVLWAKLWGDHPQHWGARVREDKRLEYRPGRRQGRQKENFHPPPACRCEEEVWRATRQCCAQYITNQLTKTRFRFKYIYRRSKRHILDKEDGRERRKGGVKLEQPPRNNHQPSKLQS